MEKPTKHELGVVMKNEDGFEVRFERVYNFSRDVLWDAITNPDKLAMWFTDVKMNFVVGGEMVITFRDANKTESFGRIIRIKAPELFEFSWEDELATWELFEVGRSRCRLVLTYSKLADTYAFSVPAGWHVLLDQLEEILNGREECFPFGGDETEAARKMKAIYKEIVARQFPEMVKS